MKEYFLEKKDKMATSDPQQQKVYKMDYEIEQLLKNKPKRIEFKNTDFLKKAKEIFENEGVFGVSFTENKSTKISDIITYYKKVSFNKNDIKNNSEEVIFHELSHFLVSMRLGYKGKDHHNELFVFVLFNLIHKYYEIEMEELHYLAEKNKVKYVYSDILSYKKIKKEEFELLVVNEQLIGLKHQKTNETEDKDKAFIAYDLQKRICVIVSRLKNENYFITKREMFEYEINLYVNIYKDMTLKELLNLQLISPIEKNRIDVYFYVKSNSDIEFNNKLNMKSYPLINTLKKEYNQELSLFKKQGFKIKKFKEYNQFHYSREFYKKELMTKSNEAKKNH